MDERECQHQAARIDALIQEIATFPDERVRARIEELLHSLLEMYGAGLTRMVEMLAQAEPADQALLQKFAADELVSSLLLLHGLHPIGLEQRVHQAVEKIRPSVQAQSGTLELVHVEEGTASLRLAGHRKGCGASTQALKQTIENAIYSAAPDLDEIHIEEVAAPQRVGIPVRFVPPSKAKEQVSTNEQTNAKSASEQGRRGVSGKR